MYSQTIKQDIATPVCLDETRENEEPVKQVYEGNKTDVPVQKFTSVYKINETG